MMPVKVRQTRTYQGPQREATQIGTVEAGSCCCELATKGLLQLALVQGGDGLPPAVKAAAVATGSWELYPSRPRSMTQKVEMGI